MPDTPLNPDAIRVACDSARSHEPSYRARLITVEKLSERVIRAYLTVAQPVVTSVEELDALPMGSVVRGGEYDLVGEKIRHSPYPPHWCTIGEEVEAYERDLLPARVLYRPEVKP